jgi:hypothetical protein
MQNLIMKHCLVYIHILLLSLVSNTDRHPSIVGNLKLRFQTAEPALRPVYSQAESRKQDLIQTERVQICFIGFRTCHVCAR